MDIVSIKTVKLDVVLLGFALNNFLSDRDASLLSLLSSVLIACIIQNTCFDENFNC